MKKIADEMNFHGDDFHKPMTVFSVHDKYFLYNCWDSVYNELEKNVYEELRGKLDALAGGNCSKAANQALEKALWQWPRDEQGLPIRGNDDETIRSALAKVDFAVESLTLFVAQICNMKCRYCFGHGGTYGEDGGLMSEATAFGVLDWYAGQLAAKDIKKMELSFMGGEPLMNFPLIKKIIQYVEEHYAGWEINYATTTNGYFLTDEVMEFLVRHKVQILISFDGPPAIQNFNRPLTNGEDSYAAIAPKIQKLLALRPKTGCRATLYDNADPVVVENGLREIGFRDIHIVPASDSLLTDDYCPTKPCAASADKLIDAYCEKADGFLCAVKRRNAADAQKAGMNRTFRNLINGLASNNDLYEMVRRPRKFHYCATGRRMYAIDYNGEAYPCHRFVGNKKYSLGKIGGQLDADLWRKSILLESPECSRCFCRYSCGGGCAYDGVSTTGDLFMPNPVICSDYRETLKYSIYIMSQMTREDLAWLESEKIITLPKCVLDF